MNIVDIKGKSNYARFVLDDGSYIKGDGELLVKGFCVYKETLCLVANGTEKLLSEEKKNEVIASVNKFLDGKAFKVDFV